MTRWRRANHHPARSAGAFSPIFLPCLRSSFRVFRLCFFAKFSRKIRDPYGKCIIIVAVDRRSSSRATSSRILHESDRPSLFNGVVFTWSRANRFPGRRRQIGFCALFPFASPPPALPRPFHPLASRAVLPPPSCRPVDVKIFTANYTIQLFFYADDSRHRFDRRSGEEEKRRVANADFYVFFSNLYIVEKFKRSIGLVSLSLSLSLSLSSSSLHLAERHGPAAYMRE